MLPHSFPKTTLKNRASQMETGPNDDDDENVDKEYDYLNADIILEDEEEYDILNDETFGDSLTGPVNEDENSEIEPSWENYDLHNNETFGEDVDYDWEAEHEKMVSILEESPLAAKKETANRLYDNSSKKTNVVKSTEVLNRNGYRRMDNLVDGYVLRSDTAHPADTSSVGGHHQFDDDEFQNSSALTNETFNLLKQDEWNGNNVDNVSHNESYNSETSFARNYSLFSSGANLLQNAGIYIPSVTSVNSTPTQNKSIENVAKRFDSMKVQTSISDIPSVSDLEKQWINDAAASKPVINEECFKAYNSAVFVNKATTPTKTRIEPPPPPLPPFNLTDNVRNTDSSGVVSLEKMVYAGGLPTGAKVMSQGEIEFRKINAALNSGLQFPNKPPFAQPPPQLMSEAGIILFNNIRFRNSDPNAPVPVNSIINSNAFKLTMSKLHGVVDPSMLVSSEGTVPAILVNNRVASIPGLLGNTAESIASLNVFPPPPGINFDPSKLVRIPTTTSLPPPPAQPQLTSSYLTLPPSQALNGAVTIEQLRQLSKMQKEGNLSTNVDEYAGMMTEREKYWLAGVQLLQINGMDPYKDDYYFTNYQARRKGNRNKNQNQNNNTWKNQHTKDYSPLQFENSLGRVQVGSVVAPRKVIDTCLFESSPIQSSRLSDIMADDPIANTSSRKRKAIMLLIEDMYAKIVALEHLQSNLNRNKSDPATIKAELENIVVYLEDEILNLKEDFKIIMSIKKGKRLVLKFLSFCDHPGRVWYQIFEILDRIIRGDAEHYILLSYLPYFRAWLSTTDLSTLVRIANYFNRNLGYYLQDKFSVSAMANMIEHAELTYYSSKTEEQNTWMEFVVNVAEKAHSSFDSIQKPVISVKPQVLRSHLLKCKKLENGYMSYLLKIFSNTSRK